MPSQYDLIVIGSGPGGYSAAVTSAQSGKKVCIIEKDELGGVCINKGCIPTKTILNAALLRQKIKDIAEKDIPVDYQKIITRAKTVIACMKGGMEQVIKANKIDVIRGSAEVVSPGRVRVGNREVSAKKIIIGTGSRARGLKNFAFDNKRFFSAEGFLGITELPRSILIVGAGVIGCEWAGILASLGVSVVLTEVKDKILPEEDSDLTMVVLQRLKKMGVEINLNTAADKITQDSAIICVGREPVIDGVKLIETGDGGWIKVDKYLQTNIPGVYAVGDCIGPPFLAYTAEREGMIAANNAFGNKIAMDYRFIPRVIFSIPELASVGVREHEIENTGVVRAYFKGLGRACSDGETSGFVKIIYDKSNYKILGAGIVGKNAGELICEATLALRCGLTTKEWAGMVWPHPVLSEIFGTALGKVK